MEPCGSNGSQTLAVCNPLEYNAVRLFVGHIMPCHVNRIILLDAGKLLLLKGSWDNFLLFFSERLTLHIPDKSIFCTDFLPVPLIFQYRNFVLLLNLRQNGALHTALITHLSILLHCCNSRLSPIADNHQTVRVIVQFIIDIRILLNKIQRNISCASLRFQNDVIFALLFLGYIIVLAPYFHSDHILRKGI